MTPVNHDDPKSPCINVCTMNPRTHLCDGCFRTIGEIAGWSDYSSAEKRQVLAHVVERCERILDGTFLMARR